MGKRKRKYYCDYCDVFLSQPSIAVRKQHLDGNKHKMNVAEYYKHQAMMILQDKIDKVVQDFDVRLSQGLVKRTYGAVDPSVYAQGQAKPRKASTGLLEGAVDDDGIKVVNEAEAGLIKVVTEHASETQGKETQAGAAHEP